MKDETKKLNYNDVTLVEGDSVAKYWRGSEQNEWSPSEHLARLSACTHIICEVCGEETPKHHSMKCPLCQDDAFNKRYNKLDLVEWDGVTPLCLFDDDKFFFSADDIISYCEDNELLPSELKLVVCEKTRFSEVDLFDIIQDAVHEDWEMPKELIEIEKTLNNYLRSADTETWIPRNKRVILNDSIMN